MGDILVAVNPFKTLPIFDKKVGVVGEGKGAAWVLGFLVV